MAAHFSRVFVALFTQHGVVVGPVFTNPTVKYFLHIHKNILLPTTRLNLNIGYRGISREIDCVL